MWQEHFIGSQGNLGLLPTWPWLGSVTCSSSLLLSDLHMESLLNADLSAIYTSSLSGPL